MNQVSWLIYLANVAGNVGPLFGWVGAAIFIISIGWGIAAIGFMTDVNRWDDPETKKAALKVFRSQRFTSIACLAIAIIFWFMAAFTPSQNTVLAIAASQFGEQMMHNKTVNLAEEALNSWLQKQIAKVDPPTAPEAGKK